MIFTVTLFLGVLGLIIIYLWKIRQSYDYFKDLGIPGPTHRFFFGHFKDLWSAKSFSQQLQQWTHKYGSIYGLFLGRTPMYVVSDVDFLQEVYIKQFSSFHSRSLPILLRLQTGNRIHLFSAIGMRWRRQRHVLNPTFSAAKLKLMLPLVNQCIDAMLKKISECNSEKTATDLNIYTLYKRMTMDVICRCAFGIDADMQNDIDNIYLKKAAGTFALDVDKLSIVKLTNLLPFFAELFRYVYLGQTAIRRVLIRLFPALSEHIQETPGSWLTNRVREVVKFRAKCQTTEQEKRIDLLQLMIDASTTEAINDTVEDRLVPRVLHADEVVSNVFLFMIAGYETTSTALAYSTYILATKPDVQQKLVEEINQNNWQEVNDAETYDTAANLTYLDLFVREVLRMYPITSKGQIRECNLTTHVCDHLIEKGSVIQPDIFSIHYNPDLWGPEDPHVFSPERHTVKRHPCAYIPFGVGPRHCVGMRFALMELKMCLIRLLREYEVTAGEGIEHGFQREERLVIQPNAIMIQLKKRSM